MFSSKKRTAAAQAQAAAAAQARQEAALAGAGLGITTPAAPVQTRQHQKTESTASSRTTASQKPAVASPLQMTFDFELPPSPALSSPNAGDFFGTKSEEGAFFRPGTSEGATVDRLEERTGSMSFPAPSSSPIPRMPNKKQGSGRSGGTELEAEKKYEVVGGRLKVKEGENDGMKHPIVSTPRERDLGGPAPPPPRAPPSAPRQRDRERDESDNVSTASSRRSRIKSVINFDPPPDFLSFSRPTSSTGSPKVPSPPDARPATASAGSTPTMEPSLFPAREMSAAPALPRIDTAPVMSRAFIDSRDKPYSQASSQQKATRPTNTLQPTYSSPDLLATANATPSAATKNFSSPISASPTTTFTRPGPQSAQTSPNLLRNPPTSYSGSTVRSTLSSQTTAAESPTSTVGTPYQQTSPSFPLPQHVATRPKTAGAPTATIAGVSVPTHHTSALSRPETSAGKGEKVSEKPEKTEKSERRKTRLLNPMALLSRRRSGQEETAASVRPVSSEQKAVQAAQTAALKKQQNVAAVGVSKFPEDFDPRIKGKVVHDFSAPRQPRRMWSYNDAEPAWNNVARGLQSANSAPYIPPLDEDNEGGQSAHRAQKSRQSLHSNKHTSDSSSGRRSLHTGMFWEHLGESPDSQQRIHAERLENKDFLQRASHLSQQSNVSQESATLPPFARRSQVMDPVQATFVQDSDESKRSSDPSSNGNDGGGVRDSGVSSLSSISPVTARSSAIAGHDARASLSPVSPSSPDKRGSAGRPVSEMSRPGSEGRPPSSYFSLGGRGPAVAISPPDVDVPGTRSLQSEAPTTEQGMSPITEEDGTTPRPPFAMQIPMPVRTPPEIPPRGTSSPAVVSPLEGPGSGGASHLSSGLPSPSFSFPSNQPTPEPQVADTVRAPTSPPKLVEKRASAVGHAKRKSTASSKNGNAGMPKHHVSNASRFSFQFGGSAAEEKLLEEKHRRIASNDHGVGDVLGDGEDDDDFFDEDAMDDMDEMELQEEQQQQFQRVETNGNGRAPSGASSPRASVAQFMYRTPTSSPLPSGAASAWAREKAKLELQYQVSDDASSEGGEEDDDDGDEAPYWMHEDFQGYEDSEGFQSRRESAAEVATGSVASSMAGGLRKKRESGASMLTLDTNVGPAAERVRSGFYMQPLAAGYSPTTTTTKAHGKVKPPVPQRDSGNSERNRVASGLHFSSPTLGGNGHKPAQLSSSTNGSGMIADDQRPFSQSTVGGSSSSEGRTISTGLGLSGLSEFKFSDSAPPSRPISLQAEGKENRRTKDSETIPKDVDWTDNSSKASNALDHLQGRGSYGWGGEGQSNGAMGNGLRARQSSKPDILGDDDMYFDDGGFDQDVNSSVSILGKTVDEDAFDDDRVFENINGAVTREQLAAQQGHTRDLSALTVSSLGSDGPYPSFAMPHPAKARQRDSRMLLEDLPLQAAPVDPKLIPQRNPSEDAKRLGLSSKVPPLPVPVHPGNAEAIQRVNVNLQAYHAALADAANKAASEGRFLRMPSGASSARSLSTYSKGEGEKKSAEQISTDDPSHYSRNDGGEMPNNSNQVGELDRNESVETTHSKIRDSTTYSVPKLDTPPRMSFDFGFDSMPTDDATTDDFCDDFGNEDDIVAAANAEVLASDDEGFYGQEFGFYAKARSHSGELQAVNGGFFGMDGDDGLMRNKSLKEPNLTPITERSEFSTRNSFIGLGHAGSLGLPSAGPLSAASLGPISPALARLPFSPLGENEVTSFDQLRKLRAHAFGGSNASLHSHDGKSQPLQVNSDSPTLSTRSSAGAQGYFGPLGGAPMSFGYSTDSSGSSNPSSAHPAQLQTGLHNSMSFQDSPHSAASSGHLPFSMSMPENEATPKRPPPRDLSEAPLTARKVSMSSSGVNKPKISHSRNSSGTDSVTYVQEQDPAGTGQPRWVLERRRTSEQGQLELIAREIVQGGWI